MLGMPTWTPALSIIRLNAMAEATPFLVCDLDTIERRYEELTELLPGVEVFFAMKSNSAATVLRQVHEVGGSFEVASVAEMRMAEAAGAAPVDLLYSNPVKPPGHIAEAA